MPRPLIVRSADLDAALAFEGFAGLPREEVERLHGRVEVLRAGEAEPCLPLFALCVAHYNYNWLVLTPRPGALYWSLCLSRPLTAAGAELPSFLDERMDAAAREAVDAYIPREDYSFRCAGLLRAAPVGADALMLGVVYLARLHRRGTECLAAHTRHAEFWGNGELLQRREQFDAPSQILIDNLTAL